MLLLHHIYKHCESTARLFSSFDLKQRSEMTDAVLIIGGAFNPTHTQHIALLCAAKEELENEGQWRIIGGYCAVATDGYVRQKLRSRNERTMKLQHRLAIVRQAMQDIPWLVNSPYQAEMLKQHDGSALALNERLQKLMKNDHLQVLIVVGADRMVHRGVPKWRKAVKHPSALVKTVGIGRETEEGINLRHLWRDDLNKNLIPQPNIFILLRTSVQTVSSTMVRTHLHRWLLAKNDPAQQREIEEDLVHRLGYLHASVMDYIKIHEDGLYLDT